MTVLAQKCYECGGMMKGRRENYRYVESGLKNVILRDILVFHCEACGAVVPEITDTSTVHALIGIRLLFQEGRLNGGEVRFLRKLVGYSATELATLTGTSKSVVSRWENKSTLGEKTDRLVRLIFLNKILKDAFPMMCDPDEASQVVPANTKTLFDFSNFPKVMENVLKRLQAKESTKRVEIEREELEQLAAPAAVINADKFEYVS